MDKDTAKAQLKLIIDKVCSDGRTELRSKIEILESLGTDLECTLMVLEAQQRELDGDDEDDEDDEEDEDEEDEDLATRTRMMKLRVTKTKTKTRTTGLSHVRNTYTPQLPQA